MAQRWVKLPNGGYLDANCIVLIGKPDSYMRTDEEGNANQEFAVSLGTDVSRDRQMIVTGSKEEISKLIQTLAGAG
jgi:hypothetical protein